MSGATDMAITAQQIIDRAAKLLNDPDNLSWSEPELVEHLSEAQRAAVLVRPETYPVTETAPLTPGSAQELPDDGFVLIECVRNMGLDGNTPGRAITPVERASLDQTRPDWHTEAPDSIAVNFVYDVRNRRTFYVWPPQPNPAHQIEIVYAKIPEDIADATAPLDLDAIYSPALLHYVLHLALLKDIPESGSQRSAEHFARFTDLLLGRAEEQDVDLTIRHETAEGGSRNHDVRRSSRGR